MPDLGTAGLGQRPARHQQYFPAERRGCKEFVQRKDDQPGGLRQSGERNWSRTSSALSALPVQSSASVYLAIGESLPSPAPETIQEVRVNTSMYDAQQGSTSGAHIDMSTASGTNDVHGSFYVHRGTNWLECRSLFLQCRPEYSRRRKESRACTATVPAETWAFPSSRTNSSFSEATSTRICGRGNRNLPAYRPTWLTSDRSTGGSAAVGNDNNLSAFLDWPTGPVKSDSRTERPVTSIRSLIRSSITSCPNGQLSDSLSESERDLALNTEPIRL